MPSGGPAETVSPATSNGTSNPEIPSKDPSPPLSILPSVFTKQVVITAEGAVLLAMVNPKSEETDVWFEWGYDPAIEEARRGEAQRVHPDNAIRPISYKTGNI
jgi:hypothetical protein